jgi:hypothetical protein
MALFFNVHNKKLNFMKQSFLLIIIAFLFSVVGNGQSKSDKMFNIFDDRDGVTDFSFSKNMIDAIDLDIGDDDNERKVTGDLHKIRFMSYNPEKGDLSGPDFIKKAISYLPKSAYKCYEGEDDDDDAEIWLLGGKKKYQECHVFVKNKNSEGFQFIVSFFGDFLVDDIERLKKAGKGFSKDD